MAGLSIDDLLPGVEIDKHPDMPMLNDPRNLYVVLADKLAKNAWNSRWKFAICMNNSILCIVSNPSVYERHA
jgi:hypothetical protein